MPSTVEPGVVTWRFELDPRAEREICIEVGVGLGGHDAPATLPVRRRSRVSRCREQRLASWRDAMPVVDSDSPALMSAVARARDDLGALRIFDPDHPELPVIAAGAPWFMAVFGRDSLITGWMSLLADPNLALGVVETLARFQGTDVNPATEEEPGRILHEMRFGAATGLALGGGQIYYGTIDATPLFVMLLGELRRWGLADDDVDRLLPHADAALAWIETFGDRDGDGYVEYERATPSGLANQGWKDSWDGVRFADGRLPETPVALCEVQGYTYAAYLARAQFARTAGDATTQARYLDEGSTAEGDVQPGLLARGPRVVRARPRRRQAADRRVGQQHGSLPVDRHRRRRQGDASSPSGCCHPSCSAAGAIRTLATSMSAYNPVSYHNGSVWPHDNAAVRGRSDALRVRRGGPPHHRGTPRGGRRERWTTARAVRRPLPRRRVRPGRLPDVVRASGLGCGGPAAAASRDCSASTRRQPRTALWVAPALPASIRRCRIEGIDVAGRRLTIDVDGDTCEVTGAQALDVVASPRPSGDP